MLIRCTGRKRGADDTAKAAIISAKAGTSVPSVVEKVVYQWLAPVKSTVGKAIAKPPQRQANIQSEPRPIRPLVTQTHLAAIA